MVRTPELSQAQGAVLAGRKGGDGFRRLGPYLLDTIVGRGTSGMVWRAYDENSGELVALKLLDAETAADPLSRARFERECELVGAFSHPRLARLRARGAVGGCPYLVMELALGQTLQSRLRSSVRPTVETALHIAMDAAAGLSAMHGAGWVHRDVKPGNLVLDPQDRPLIIDFGLAARASSSRERLTRAGYFVGTPLYLAPEQLIGADPSPRMDVYAIGVLLFEMLAGSPPFSGTSEALLTAKAREAAPRFRGLAPLSDLLARLLSRNPEDRPADGYALAATLRQVLLALGSSPHSEDLQQPVPGSGPRQGPDSPGPFGSARAMAMENTGPSNSIPKPDPQLTNLLRVIDELAAPPSTVEGPTRDWLWAVSMTSLSLGLGWAWPKLLSVLCSLSGS